MIETGTDHPLRKSISHPYAAVPHTSNVNQDANKESHTQKTGGKQSTESLLHLRTDSDETSKRGEIGS